MKKLILSFYLPLMVFAFTPASYTTVQLTKVAKRCCSVCSVGKACGNSCIARNKACHKAPGCACNR